MSSRCAADWQHKADPSRMGHDLDDHGFLGVDTLRLHDTPEYGEVVLIKGAAGALRPHRCRRE